MWMSCSPLPGDRLFDHGAAILAATGVSMLIRPSGGHLSMALLALLGLCASRMHRRGGRLTRDGRPC
jgi:hypothetical protein